jgi:hypothetical protein
MPPSAPRLAGPGSSAPSAQRATGGTVAGGARPHLHSTTGRDLLWGHDSLRGARTPSVKAVGKRSLRLGIISEADTGGRRCGTEAGGPAEALESQRRVVILFFGSYKKMKGAVGGSRWL